MCPTQYIYVLQYIMSYPVYICPTQYIVHMYLYNVHTNGTCQVFCIENLNTVQSNRTLRPGFDPTPYLKEQQFIQYLCIESFTVSHTNYFYISRFAAKSGLDAYTYGTLSIWTSTVRNGKECKSWHGNNIFYFYSRGNLESGSFSYMRNSVCKYLRNYAELRGIPEIFTAKNTAEFREIPYVFQKIPYSVGSKKRTSVDTLYTSSKF
jgi:hypothetical protein